VFDRGGSKEKKRGEKRSCGWIGVVDVVGAVIGKWRWIYHIRQRECRG
jgi:predicted transcriptional regulator